jgi:hypothetical protein
VKVEGELQEPKSLREAVVRNVALFNGDRMLLTRHITRKAAASSGDFEVATRLIEEEVSTVCQFDLARKCWLIREPFDELLPPKQCRDVGYTHGVVKGDGRTPGAQTYVSQIDPRTARRGGARCRRAGRDV